jgi:hypothetical protein
MLLPPACRRATRLRIWPNGLASTGKRPSASSPHRPIDPTNHLAEQATGFVVIDRHIRQRTQGRAVRKAAGGANASGRRSPPASNRVGRSFRSCSTRCKLIWAVQAHLVGTIAAATVGRSFRSCLARLGARSSGQCKLIWTVQAHLVGTSSSGRYSTAVAVAVRPLAASPAPCLSVVLPGPPGAPGNGYKIRNL